MKVWGNSLVVRRLGLSFHCRGCRFNPWLGCVLSCFSRVGLSATPWTVACCPWDSLGKKETRLSWHPTRGSLTSPSYLVRNRTLAPPLENNPEIPVAPGEEHWLLDTSLDEVYWPSVTREQSPAFLRNSNGRLDLPGPTQEAA